MNAAAIEKLKKEFKTTDDMGKIIINNCLLPELKNNEEFSKKILDKSKTVKDMLSQVKSWVQKSKNHAPSHDVIFSLALHYYQEDNPDYVEELTKEEPLEFGNINKAFNTPIIKHITGTIIKEVIKEVTKEITKKTKKKDIPKKVKKTVKNNLKDINQLSLFEE